MALIKCPECGNQFSEYAECCPHCGLPTKEIQSYIKCPECGNLFVKVAEHCPHCGFPTSEIPIYKEGVVIQEAPSEEPKTETVNGAEIVEPPIDVSVETPPRQSNKKRVRWIVALCGLGLWGLFLYINFGDSDDEYYYENNNNYSAPKQVEQKDYKWIVGTWYLSTPYGTTSIRFTGNGSSGDVTELEDALNPYSAKSGTYYVENDVLYYTLRGESWSTTMEIHSGHKLYAGNGYYYKKIQ